MTAAHEHDGRDRYEAQRQSIRSCEADVQLDVDCGKPGERAKIADP